MALSMMKDEERLDLLKEIGGSKVYEDRRKESLKVIQDADGRTQQIAELVGLGKTLFSHMNLMQFQSSIRLF